MNCLPTMSWACALPLPGRIAPPRKAIGTDGIRGTQHYFSHVWSSLNNIPKRPRDASVSMRRRVLLRFVGGPGPIDHERVDGLRLRDGHLAELRHAFARPGAADDDAQEFG